MRMVTVVGMLFAAGHATAQLDTIIADRDRDSIWRFHDANADGVIQDPGEVSAFFTPTNVPLTLPLQNPTAMGSWLDGRVVVGDQINRNVYLLRDLNGDGDAMDAGESRVIVDATNLSGASFAFPTGVAFDAVGRIHVVNAGNTMGNDVVFRLEDGNGDGDMQDAGEVTAFVGEGAFGPGNGAYSPQELFFGGDGSLFLRNSSTALHGVYRARDLDGNGRADDAGEFGLFFGAGNGAGITLAAGFALEPDGIRSGAMYMLQTLTGGIDHLVRVHDLNGDGDAMDAGEAQEVWRTPETGFTGIDVVSLLDGTVLVTDNSGKRVIVLRDTNADGLFDQVGERATHFVSGLTVVGDVRQMSRLFRCRADFNQDGSVDFFDYDDFVSCFDGVACPPGASGDYNGDFSVDFFDYDDFVSGFEVGC